jgi:sugar phosphate isomerase/epimerase
MFEKTSLSRRQWLASAGSLVAAPLLAQKAQQLLGVQLYTVRGTLMKDSDHVLKTIAEIGYREIEGQGRENLIALAPKIKELGMAPVSCHVETPIITGDWEKYKGTKPIEAQAAIDSVKAIGVKYFTMAYIQPQARGDLDFFRKTADQMNHVGELCKKSGLQFAYHNHAFEFGGVKGKRPIDIFHSRLDKKLVTLEMDVFWVTVAGNDPVEMLTAWKGRVQLLHLKDMQKGTPVQYNETLPPTAFKEVGSGVVNFPAIFRACPDAGVKHFFVEQDQTPGDPLVSLRQSFHYITTL